MANGNGTAAIQNVAPSTLEAKQSFGEQSLSVRTETATAAVAASEQAKVQARYIVAMQRPRDWMTVRAKLLDACRRPGFASAARYSKPVSGQKIEGPSVRFAEEALRSMGNAIPEQSVIYDDEAKRIVRIAVTDLESNLSYSTDITIEKTVERKELKEGQVPLGSRKNSWGKTTYLLPATEDEVANKVNAASSKALRNNALRILPADILEEAMAQCVETIRRDVADDPTAATKKIADAFAALRIMPNELAEYLGHPLDQSSPAEIVELRAVYQAIKDGETTWKATLEGRAESKGKKRSESGAKERIKQRTGTVDTTGVPISEDPGPEPPADYGRQPGDD